MLFALVILLSVEAYKDTQLDANEEADSVRKQFQLAAYFPAREQFTIQSELICYGRSVSELEWTITTGDESSAVVEGWASSIDSAAETATIAGPRAEAGFQLFLEQALERQENRRGRLEGASGALPALVWPILILGALAIVAFVILHADRSERVVAQSFQVGLTTLILGASLFLINALNHPFVVDPGSIEATEMQHAVEHMEANLATALDASSLGAVLPCDSAGLATEQETKAHTFPPGSTMRRIVDRGKLTVGVSYKNALFGSSDPISGEAVGFDIEVAREIGAELGLRPEQIEFLDILTDERLQVLQDGRADLVVMTLTITSARAEAINFSRPYYLAGQSLLIRRSDRSISGLRDLAGKRVCVIEGSTGVQTLSQQTPDATLVRARSGGSCVGEVLSGGVDAMSTDDVILAGFSAQDDELLLVGGKFTSEPYGVGIPKANADMVEFVNHAIERMIDDGRWGRIYRTYLADIPGLPDVHEAKSQLLATHP